MYTTALMIAAIAAASAADVHESKPLIADGDVDISNICGEVSIAGTGGDTVEIVGELEKNAELVFESNGRDARIEIKQRDKRHDHDMCAVLRINVPAGVRLDAATVSADISAGSLTNQVELVSVSGDLFLGAGARLVEATTVSGDVRVEGAGAELELETVSGEVEIKDARGRVEIASVSGDIEIRGGPYERVEVETISGEVSVSGALAKSARVSIAAHSGDVILEIPDSTSGRFDLTSFSGDLKATGQKSEGGFGPGSSMSFTRGDGDAQISLNSFSGDIEIREK
jgi:DUF4097 and DUF4098 domain-containing protein YvlB